MTAHVLKVRNVNQALAEGLAWLRVAGHKEDSRNGPVLVAPGPVLTEYSRPMERVLFSAQRDANPYFHLMEAIWMLAGKNDLAFPARFNKRMREFSHDGEVLHGAYGFRWREWFGVDQLDILVAHLREQPSSRRAVLEMWSANGDLVTSEGAGGIAMPDIPCNTHAYFAVEKGALNMTVCCRSNDIVWGAYGANSVHFSLLQEWVAAALGLRVGRLYQFSSNYHAYCALPGIAEMLETPQCDDRYTAGFAAHYPLMAPGEDPWRLIFEAEAFCERPGPSLHGVGDTAFFRNVVEPMWRSWEERRTGGGDGMAPLQDCMAEDWRRAAMEWIERRRVRAVS